MKELYVYQKRVARLVRQGRSIILQAPTGAGKTLAALWPFLQAWAANNPNVPHKSIYAVPMRVLANQFDEEYKHLIASEMLLHSPPTIRKQTGEYKEDPEFRADLIFATIDQVLSSWLLHPYSLSQRKGNLNAGAFVGSYLVFDEFHLFDPDSTLPTTLHMLKTLQGVSPFVLMTATFSAEMLTNLAQTLNAVPVLLTSEELAEIPAQHKDRRYQTHADSLTWRDEDKRTLANPAAMDHILSCHQAQQGWQRTLVVCNQVERAQAVYQALRALSPAEVQVELLHSRFLFADRQDKEKQLQKEFGKALEQRSAPSLIVVATQVVEVGLDLSAAVLHTELAPASAILQRAGRCARYAGESGQVHVYWLPKDGLQPYGERLAAEQCDLTWEWLQANQDRHLTFVDEQAFINHVHTKADAAMIRNLRLNKLDLDAEVRRLWRGEGDRGEASKLIRATNSLTIMVHGEPDRLAHDPFGVEQFSLFPGTLIGKYKAWQSANDALDGDWDDGKLPWLVQRLVEERNEDDAQANRPIRYTFKPVRSENELYASLLVINPALVGYSAELGLTLYPGTPYQAAIPPATRDASKRPPYSYRLESYQRHIELVHAAFRELALRDVRLAGQRLERAFGWESGSVEEVAHLVIVGHDLGKLSVAWQDAVRRWQQQVGETVPTFAIAHTDFDPERHAHFKRVPLPHHAVESAVAAIPLLEALLPDDQAYDPLLRAAFTAIARHHAPFSAEIAPFHLIPDHRQSVEPTLAWLPSAVAEQIADKPLHDRVKPDQQLAFRHELDRAYWVHETEPADMCTYMLLVRVLRLADQEGTARGIY